jgi:hypothetical protein
MRSKLWDPSQHVERHSFPTLGRIIAEQTSAVEVEAAEKTWRRPTARGFTERR